MVISPCLTTATSSCIPADRLLCTFTPCNRLKLATGPLLAPLSLDTKAVRQCYCSVWESFSTKLFVPSNYSVGHRLLQFYLRSGRRFTSDNTMCGLAFCVAQSRGETNSTMAKEAGKETVLRVKRKRNDIPFESLCEFLLQKKTQCTVPCTSVFPQVQQDVSLHLSATPVLRRKWARFSTLDS